MQRRKFCEIAGIGAGVFMPLTAKAHGKTLLITSLQERLMNG